MTETNINHIRYYNQIFIKHKVLTFYVCAQILFSYFFASGIAIILGISFAYGFPWYNALLTFVLCFELTCVLIAFVRIKKAYINILLFVALLAVGFFVNPIEVVLTNILIAGAGIIMLSPLFLFSLKKLLYSEKKINISITFENSLLKKRSTVKLLIFEFLFLFRKKKKFLLSTILLSLIFFFVIIFDRLKNPESYLLATSVAGTFETFGFGFITGGIIILCGPYIFSWSLFYLNELLLKGLSVKKILISKLLFLIFSTVIMYAITFPLIAYLNIFPTVYTISTIFNAFILSIITLVISSFNLSKVNIDINPEKYKESGFLQSIIIMILQRAFMFLYALLSKFWNDTEIMFFVCSLSFLTFLFYPLIIQKLEIAILKRRRSYGSNK